MLGALLQAQAIELLRRALDDALTFERASRSLARTGFKIRSQRLINELKTFVYINGRPDHMKGHHDDLIMSLAMALYVAQTSFTQLKKNVAQAKAMLDAWVSDERKFRTSNKFT